MLPKTETACKESVQLSCKGDHLRCFDRERERDTHNGTAERHRIRNAIVRREDHFSASLRGAQLCCNCENQKHAGVPFSSFSSLPEVAALSGGEKRFPPF